MFPHTRIKGPSLYYFRKVGGKVHEIKLGRLDEGEAVLRAKYHAILSPSPRTVGDLMFAWQQEPHRLAEGTLHEYNRYIRVKLEPIFGSIPIDMLKSSDVAMYLERRGNVAGNREIACLSTIIEWARRKGLAEHNPCYGVRRNRETPRKHYVTHRELGAALKATTPEFRDFLLAAYLTGFRQGDLRALKWSQVSKRGISLGESKTGKRVAMGRSVALSALLKRARDRTGGEYVFVNSDGEPWSLWAVQSAMRRLNVPWTFHDLRAKAESDHKRGLGLLTRYKRARQLEPTR